ncbi:MAG: outer membrane protein assembly factor BamC [gamma proteobacterium symbiont of Bathyaustriella thionipta]|nr:outer membrane protein assembly factor BamC [gamma proteobacterium symbiont of Bathyaustriella thionipta]MCU7950558.1 outer membrane protein assembly factor BamC [gamma proteobacterium symbiont of Bathyaustriella thionipta]MCU7953069.1 outer membrane protein assembly factor BamC [gamma proteobacterium symbiont of Bathyaustriella thionipta]MCU7957064.1 outer membrane protein assembly factor BamC [gamma proteobacterium symbiont of Bathyaustriella thionipta]MCU7966618.1 outer membrane protein a
MKQSASENKSFSQDNSSLSQFHKLTLTIAIASTLAACDSMPDMNDTFAGRKVDYEHQSRDVEPLEIPPDLTTANYDEMMVVPDINTGEGSTSYQDYSRERQGNRVVVDKVLPKQDNIKLVREGDDARYLVITGTKEQAWEKMREFWLNSGMLIKRENPGTGILETEWAENRADIPQDFIRSALSYVMESFYSAGTRDKYRVRIEEAEQDNKINLFLTHYGMEEVIENETTERTIWKPRPRDPELEVEMLGRMMVYMGVEEQKAKALLARSATRKVDKATISRNAQGNSRLVVKETFPRAWRRTGVSLDRISFVVEDRNREKGIYYVQYVDPLAESSDQGFFSKMKFWKDKVAVDQSKYQIKLLPRGDDTVIIVLDSNGQPDISKTAYRILNLLHEQLK